MRAFPIAKVLFGAGLSIGLTAMPAQGAAQRAAALVETDGFKVEMKPAGACSAAKECKVTIALQARGTFHINEKYPIKFKATDPAPDGLNYSKKIVKREDGQFDTHKGTLPIAFTASKSGKVEVSGTFSFSVCTDATCEMHKEELALDVQVK